MGINDILNEFSLRYHFTQNKPGNSECFKEIFQTFDFIEKMGKIWLTKYRKCSYLWLFLYYIQKIKN